MAAAQQENMFYGYTLPQVPTDMGMTIPAMSSEPVPMMPTVASTVPDMITSSNVDPKSVAKRLNERYGRFSFFFPTCSQISHKLTKVLIAHIQLLFFLGVR